MRALERVVVNVEPLSMPLGHLVEVLQLVVARRRRLHVPRL